MLVLFSEVAKERSKYINAINNINQILKNTFESFILDDKGVIFESVNKLELGYHMAFSDLNKYLCVPEGKMIKISASELFKAIKDRKKELSGYGIAENIVHFITDTGDRIIIGKVLSDKEAYDVVNKSETFINIWDNANEHNQINEDDKELLLNKEILTKEHQEYKMILSHKLLPQLKKSENVMIHIHQSQNENMFVGIFEMYHKLGIKTIHFYKFLKI